MLLTSSEQRPRMQLITLQRTELHPLDDLAPDDKSAEAEKSWSNPFEPEPQGLLKRSRFCVTQGEGLLSHTWSSCDPGFNPSTYSMRETNTPSAIDYGRIGLTPRQSACIRSTSFHTDLALDKGREGVGPGEDSRRPRFASPLASCKTPEPMKSTLSDLHRCNASPS